ncbi:MAG: hypothetical protein ACC613_01655 [Synergistales bacterium]
MRMKQATICGLIIAFVLAAGCAFAASSGVGAETQFELAQKFMERAGLTGTPAEEPVTEEPVVEEEVEEEEVEETMPPEIAAMVAERHAFIGWAKMNGLPASRNIQNQETWGAVWGSVQTQVATGVTVQEAIAAAQAAMTEEDLAALETLKETPPGQLRKSAATEETVSTASTETGKGKGKSEGKGEGKGGGKDGKDGKGGGKDK